MSLIGKPSPLPPVDGVGAVSQAASMGFMRSISGPGASMTCWAKATASAGTPSLAGSVLFVRTACWWRGINHLGEHHVRIVVLGNAIREALLIGH